MTQHILFKAAGLKLAIESQFVRAIHEQLPVQTVAGTRNWFLGLAVADGKLLPVTDLGAFSGMRGCAGNTLELVTEGTVAALRVDEVTGMSDVQVIDKSTELPCSKALAQQLAFTGDTVRNKGDVHQVFDVSALVQSAAFVNIKDIQS